MFINEFIAKLTILPIPDTVLRVKKPTTWHIFSIKFNVLVNVNPFCS